MQKPDNVTIVHIASSEGSTAGGSSVARVFGLGDDQQVYYWDNTSHKWVLYAS